MTQEFLYNEKLYGLEKEFQELLYLYENNNLPNKILFSGLKGSGKCTLAYHLINCILSSFDNIKYDKKKFLINKESKTFKLIENGTNPNFYLIDIKPEKKSIDINQIRELINKLIKSSFNNKPRFILIDNIEFLNINSINALLKILEEPNYNIFFILIHNNKKILSTLKSRCIDFKISLSHSKSIEIANKITNENVNKLINRDIMNYYLTPGDIVNIINFSKEYKLSLEEIDLKIFLNILINDKIYKKETSIKYLIFNFIENFLRKNLERLTTQNLNEFFKKINRMKKFNLDEESFFIEFNSKILNG
jgi:DNA polymerase III subunit delta'